MENMTQLFRDIANISGSTDKIAKLASFPDVNELQEILVRALSPFITYGIKKYEFGEPILTDGIDDKSFKLILWICYQLENRIVTGNDAKQLLLKETVKLNQDEQDLLSIILDRDLKCGVGVALVNKLFSGLIREFDVQLAHDFNKYADKVKYPVVAEIKYNGTRNIAIVSGNSVTHYSRNGHERENYHCFDEQLIEMSGGSHVVFDGEVQGIGGQLETYQASQQQARRKTNVDMTNQRFIIWDFLPICEFSKGHSPTPQSTRRKLLEDYYNAFLEETKIEKFTVSLSKAKIINNAVELEAYYQKMLDQDFEGLIVKDPNAGYDTKRTKSWLKLKPSTYEDLKIVEVQEGLDSRTGMLGSVIVDRKGVKVHCPPGKGVNMYDLKRLWKIRKDLIGRIAEVKYQNVTPDGSLFLPKFEHIKED